MTPYELYQLSNYGNILPSPGTAPANDYDRILEDRQDTIIEIEVNNLNNE